MHYQDSGHSSQRPVHLPMSNYLPINILWRTSTLVSMVLAGEGLALIMSLTPGFSIDRWVYFGLSSMLIQWIILITLGFLYLLKDRISHFTVNALSWLSLILLVLNTLIICALCWYVYHRISPIANSSSVYFMLQCSAIAITVGLLGLIALQHHWHGHQLATANKQAELDMLQARIQPHFLFNTLNTGAALVHQHPAQAEQLLLDLSELFRAALSQSKLIRLEDELLLARRYLEIEILRFGERIRINWQLPDLIPEVLLPALSVQPLVENAVRHGVEPSENGGDICISVQQIGNRVLIIVSNSMSSGSNSVRQGHSIGLASTRQRIENYSDGEGHLSTEIKNGRYEATISLPT
jgi:two-component system, LytTR family, sensor histidine kinase AlgZ